MYEGQSISNASYFFSFTFQENSNTIRLHSLKTTTLTINLSLFNIISVHFHRFGPPFNKGMYSSPVKSKVLSPKPLTHGRFHLVCPSASLQRRTHRLTVLTSTVCIPIHIFQPFMYANGHFTFCSQEFNYRTLSNRAGIHALVKRWTKTVEMDGDYIEQWQINRQCCGFQAM